MRRTYCFGVEGERNYFMGQSKRELFISDCTTTTSLRNTCSFHSYNCIQAGWGAWFLMCSCQTAPSMSHRFFQVLFCLFNECALCSEQEDGRNRFVVNVCSVRLAQFTIREYLIRLVIMHEDAWQIQGSRRWYFFAWTVFFCQQTSQAWWVRSKPTHFFRDCVRNPVNT